MKTVALREVAHSRAGEKGNDCQVSVIAYRESDYWILREQVTAEAAAAVFGAIVESRNIVRYEVESIGALNFVLHNALSGGRSRTIAFEESGKALGSVILRLEVNVPDDYLTRREDVLASHEHA